MPNAVQWVAGSPATLMTTDLDNLGNDAFVVASADYDNATNKHRWADFQLVAYDFDAAPTAGAVLELHLFTKYDGSTYADGFDGDADADSVPGPNTLIGCFVVSASDNPQQLAIRGVRLPPYAFKACIVNRSGQDLADSSSHTLKLFPYDEEVQ